MIQERIRREFNRWADSGRGRGLEKRHWETTRQLIDLMNVGEYDNVIAHLCGHSHVHRVTPIEPMGGHPYWEIITSAIADHPHQMRIFEVRDEDNGYYSLSSIALDVAMPDDDPIAQEGRLRGITDNTSGWQPTGEGVPEDRNVRLFFQLP